MITQSQTAFIPPSLPPSRVLSFTLAKSLFVSVSVLQTNTTSQSLDAYFFWIIFIVILRSWWRIWRCGKIKTQTTCEWTEKQRDGMETERWNEDREIVTERNTKGINTCDDNFTYVCVHVCMCTCMFLHIHNYKYVCVCLITYCIIWFCKFTNESCHKQTQTQINSPEMLPFFLHQFFIFKI